MKIRVHIERLVLAGLPVSSAQGAAVQAALERELASAMKTGGLSPELRSGGAFPAMRAVDTGFREHNPEAMGAGIARSVYGAIGRAK